MDNNIISRFISFLRTHLRLLSIFGLLIVALVGYFIWVSGGHPVTSIPSTKTVSSLSGAAAPYLVAQSFWGFKDDAGHDICTFAIGIDFRVPKLSDQDSKLVWSIINQADRSAKDVRSKVSGKIDALYPTGSNANPGTIINIRPPCQDGLDELEGIVAGYNLQIGTVLSAAGYTTNGDIAADGFLVLTK